VAPAQHIVGHDATLEDLDFVSQVASIEGRFQADRARSQDRDPSWGFDSHDELIHERKNGIGQAATCSTVR
jgi:hypothetical protein